MAHRVLIVGGGSIGERHARCFLQTGRCQVSLCDLDAALCARLDEKYPLSGTFTNLESALQHPWDAAVIATPAHVHVEQAMAAAQQGIHLFIEKPLSTHLHGVGPLLATVARQGLIANVGYVYRAHPAVAELKAFLDTQALGPILHLTLTAGQHFPTYRPAYREIYYAHRRTGGGAIQDALTHMIDLVQHLAGPFDWVFADGAHQVLEGVEVEDTVNLLGRLNSEKVLASLTMNQFMAPNEIHLELHGIHGSARLEFHRQQWGTLRHGETEWTMRQSLLPERDQLFIRQANAFLDAIERRAPVLCSLFEALHTLRVNLAALSSATDLKPVAIIHVG
jgi:predicted dehydrogenase